MKALLITIALLGSMPCRGGDAPMRLEVLGVPFPIHLKHPENPTDESPPEHYPMVRNRIAKCLPGELYDVRAFLRDSGAGIKDGGFAWYSPTAKLLVVRTASDDLDFVETIVSPGCTLAAINLHVSGEIFIQPAGGGQVPPTQRIRWESDTQSGLQAISGANGKGALSYSCELEVIILPNNQQADLRASLKVTFEERDYSIISSAGIALSKPHAVLLGTTPSGDEVRFQITASVQPVVPALGRDDAGGRKRLKECIEKALGSR
jgi:hypothetical protein